MDLVSVMLCQCPLNLVAHLQCKLHQGGVAGEGVEDLESVRKGEKKFFF